MAKFNTYSRDSFEGTLYTLPQSLQWKDLADCEGIELSTQGGEAVDRDISILNNAVRMLQMKKRAQEEIEMVKEDMKRSVDFSVAEHSLLQTHLKRIHGDEQTKYTRGCLNLLCHRILQCEITLSVFSKSFPPHVSCDYPRSLLLSAAQDFVESTSDSFEDSLLSSSEDSLESDSSSDSSAED